MRLKVVLPVEVVWEGQISRLSAEGVEGAFTILPHHISYVTALVPGMLFFQPEGDGEEQFIAVDEGMLIKAGEAVTVLVHNAILGGSLGEIEARMRERFYDIDEQRRRANTALARLEADFVRRYMELGDDRSG